MCGTEERIVNGTLGEDGTHGCYSVQLVILVSNIVLNTGGEGHGGGRAGGGICCRRGRRVAAVEQPLLPLAFEASEINVAISTVVSLKWMLNGNANVEEASAIMSALGVRKCISNAGKE